MLFSLTASLISLSLSLSLPLFLPRAYEIAQFHFLSLLVISLAVLLRIHLPIVSDASLFYISRRPSLIFLVLSFGCSFVRLVFSSFSASHCLRDSPFEQTYIFFRIRNHCCQCTGKVARRNEMRNITKNCLKRGRERALPHFRNVLILLIIILNSLCCTPGSSPMTRKEINKQSNALDRSDRTGSSSVTGGFFCLCRDGSTFNLDCRKINRPRGESRKGKFSPMTLLMTSR